MLQIGCAVYCCMINFSRLLAGTTGQITHVINTVEVAGPPVSLTVQNNTTN